MIGRGRVDQTNFQFRLGADLTRQFSGVTLNPPTRRSHIWRSKDEEWSQLFQFVNVKGVLGKDKFPGGKYIESVTAQRVERVMYLNGHMLSKGLTSYGTSWFKAVIQTTVARAVTMKDCVPDGGQRVDLLLLPATAKMTYNSEATPAGT
ncbi:hypothetical protein J6590_040277 [Homalodisca vitripennis]|nr:hypothetical protein J6590_040277 [Homalodisca vitripennis]